MAAPPATIPVVPVEGPPPVAPAANSSLYVGDLDRDVTEQQLFELFSQVRTVASSLVLVTACSLVLFLLHSLGYSADRARWLHPCVPRRCDASLAGLLLRELQRIAGPAGWCVRGSRGWDRCSTQRRRYVPRSDT